MRPTRSRALAAVCAAAAAAAACALVATPVATAAEPTVPFIAEFHYDNAGADAGEFVEVQVPPAPPRMAGRSCSTTAAMERPMTPTCSRRSARRPAARPLWR